MGSEGTTADITLFTIPALASGTVVIDQVKVVVGAAGFGCSSFTVYLRLGASSLFAPIQDDSSCAKTGAGTDPQAVNNPNMSESSGELSLIITPDSFSFYCEYRAQIEYVLKTPTSPSALTTWPHNPTTYSTCSAMLQDTISSIPDYYGVIQTSATHTTDPVTLVNIPASTLNHKTVNNVMLVVGGNGPDCSASFSVMA